MFWVVLKKKRVLLYILATLMLYSPILRWVNYTPRNNQKSNFKVVTMNIKAGKFGRNKIENYLQQSDADVVMVQEYGNKFGLEDYAFGQNKYEIVTLRSKWEIIHSEKIATTGNGNAFLVDIKFHNQTIRVINMYLSPFSFEKKKVKPKDEFSKNKYTLKYIIRTLIPTFKTHEKEMGDIRNAIEDSPYPIILAGDFNAVPNSYEYYQISERLTDSFFACGRGSGTSFHDYKFPIRIDYIFSSKEIKPIEYHIDRSVKLSDHFPVIAKFKID